LDWLWKSTATTEPTPNMPYEIILLVYRGSCPNKVTYSDIIIIVTIIIIIISSSSSSSSSSLLWIILLTLL
jgi:hypothetical protein